MPPSPSPLPVPLVSTEWLASHLGRPGLAILDASWYLPQQARDARAEFLAGHIPGAGFFDLDAASDHASDLPHMLPAAGDFAATMARLGVANDSAVVVYDGSANQMSAPRLWWMLRVFGHDRVAVLDGGLRKWLAEGGPVEQGLPAPPAAVTFTAHLRPGLVRSRRQLDAAAGSGLLQPVDARSGERFRGEVDEPRPGLRRGHLPGARSLPYTALVNPATGTYLPPEELRAQFAAVGLDLDRPIVAYCGSGVTACSLALAISLAGGGEVAVYDGSWAEWGRATP